MSLYGVVDNDLCLSLPDVESSEASEPEVAARNDSRAEGNVSRKKRDRSVNMFITHDEEPLKAHCKQCTFTCNNASQLALHMKTGHQDAPCKQGNFKCPECNLNTPKKEVLIWHLSHHTGNHSINYYACRGCDLEKHCASDIQKHINKRHGKVSKCNAVAFVVENVRYLQNIMKCPICKDGLLWKQIFIEHLQDKHNLLALAHYLATNYGDDCPNSLSYPGHLLDSTAEIPADSDNEVAVPSLASTISRFHCEDCDFSTDDSDAFWRHQTSHSQTSREPAAVQSEDKTSGTEAVQSGNILYHRAAKIKAYAQIISPPVPKQQSWSPKRIFNFRRKSPTASASKQTSSQFNKCHKPFSRTAKASPKAKASDAPVVSKTAAAKPLSSGDTDFCGEFIDKLPSSFVFAQNIKCPKCSFASRIRSNLLRHVMSHATVSNRNSALVPESSNSAVHLSYDLWKPDSSSAGRKSTEEEPVATQMPDIRNDDANEVERSSSSQTTESSLESDVRGASDNETEDEEPSREPEKFCCETCSAEFTSEVSLERHITESHGGPYLCHLCGMLMWQQSAVRDHYRAVHPGTPIQFELLHRQKAVDGTSEKKIARVQGSLHRCNVLLRILCLCLTGIACVDFVILFAIIRFHLLSFFC